MSACAPHLFVFSYRTRVLCHTLFCRNNHWNQCACACVPNGGMSMQYACGRDVKWWRTVKSKKTTQPAIQLYYIHVDQRQFCTQERNNITPHPWSRHIPEQDSSSNTSELESDKWAASSWQDSTLDTPKSPWCRSTFQQRWLLIVRKTSSITSFRVW